MIETELGDAAAVLHNSMRPIHRASTTIEFMEVLRSFGPSLMPRSSLHQGVVTASSWLMARFVGRKTDALASLLTPPNGGRAAQIGSRAAIGVVGAGLARLPGQNNTHWPAAIARFTGEVLEAATIGGIAHVLIESAHRRGDDSTANRRTAILTGLTITYGMYRSGSYLRARRSYFTDEVDQLRLTLAGSVTSAVGFAALGLGIGESFKLTRRGFQRFFGPGVTHSLVADAVNLWLWGGIATATYWAGITSMGKSNETIDPGYAEPPTLPEVSGSPASPIPFEELGQQGRRYVSDVATPELIESVMGEPAVAQPIRAFVGYNSEPLYRTGRTELALDELERTNAYDRSHIVLISPTGTGWVDHTVIEAIEFFTRGDVASVCIQYGRYPSFLSLQKVRAGRAQFRQLVWGVRQRLQGMDPQDRPKVFVFGESLGAWASSDVIMKSGVAGLDHYRIDRALWFGMPALARWSAAGLDRPGQLTPKGTVGVFDRWEQLQRLSPEQRDALRIVQLSHDNDPITLLTPTLLYQEPDWLGFPRGRGIPYNQRWSPFATFMHTLIDAANAMKNEPGEFRSTGHDYRGDSARFVAEAFRLPYTEEQLKSVEQALRQLELERAQRIARTTEVDEAGRVAPYAPAYRSEQEAGDDHLFGQHRWQHRDGKEERPRNLPGSRTRGADWWSSVSATVDSRPFLPAEKTHHD